MIKRIISAAVGIAVLAAALILSNTYPIILNAVIAILSALAVWELFSATKITHKKVLLIASLVFSLAVPFLAYLNDDIIDSKIKIFVWIFIYLIVVFGVMILGKNKITASLTGLVFLMTFLISISFYSIIVVRDYALNSNVGLQKSDGIFFVILICCCAWLCDTGAYFIGKFFGKHKLCEKISPKKTVEGFIGGMIFNTAGIICLGIIYRSIAHVSVNLWICGVIGLVTAVIGPLGDLVASYIKREYGVKDFGNIMPGHGGVLDRFDSIMLVAPFVCCFVIVAEPFLPIIIR